MNFFLKSLFVLVLCSIYTGLSAQLPKDLSPSVSVSILEDPPRLEFNWTPAKNVQFQLMYRRPKSSQVWNLVARFDPDMSSFTDTIQKGINYEYQLRSLGDVRAFDFVSAGIEVRSDFLENKGIVLLMIDSLLVEDLSQEIEVLKQDMANDGWIVQQMVTFRHQTAKEIKDSLISIHVNNDERLQSIFILGHCTVPYSGNSAWDGHGNHNGAWPADVFYGVLDGIWTDTQINNTNPSRSNNDNVPGDGKWDQSKIPGKAVIAVGRVDFNNMPVFPMNEVELTRKYLNKLHKYKTLEIQAANRGLIDDNFGYFSGEAFSQSAWRSFNAFFPSDSIYSKREHNVDYFPDLSARSYMWSYGCGGGNYRGAGGIGSTFDFDSNQVQTIFTMLFGSYFGDWDVQNSFLRAPLASGTALTNCWAGRPVWFFHHMALGEHIGYSTLVSQNAVNSQYAPVGFANRGSHTSLIGDPTLRMYLFEPPTDLEVENRNDGSAQLEWSPSIDKEVIGYHVFRIGVDELTYTRLTDEPLVETSFIDIVNFEIVEYTYLVRAVKLQTTMTGSFYNLSPGVMTKVRITTSNDPLSSKSAIKLSPCPVSTSFVLNDVEYKNLPLRISIYDIQGHEVYENQVYNNNQKIDVNHLIPGIYNVSVSNDKNLVENFTIIKVLNE